MNNANFVLTTDATCDLSKNYTDERNIMVMPMSYTIDKKTYKGTEDDSLSQKDFYSKLRDGCLSQTSQINPDAFVNFFEDLLKTGVNVLHIAFSSALSGTCNNAFIAAQEVNSKFSEVKVVVVDSLCASMGEGLLVYYAAKLRDDGKTVDEVKDWIEANKLKLCHYFTVDNLFHLHRGGRVSKTAAIVGSVLGVKPILHVDDEGRLTPVSKIRGRKQALCELVDRMQSVVGHNKNEIIFISHGDCYEDAVFVADLIKERFGINNFMIDYIGPVIGTHSGPGTVALFFLGDKR